MTDLIPTDGFANVQGRCPACRGASLFLGSSGYVTCARLDCPAPDAASTLLETRATPAPVEAPAPPGRVTLTVHVDAPTMADGQHWARTLADHLHAEYGQTMRLTTAISPSATPAPNLVQAAGGEAGPTPAANVDNANATPDPDDLRERYAAAIAVADGVDWDSLCLGDALTEDYLEKADAVLAARDHELEQLRAELAAPAPDDLRDRYAAAMLADVEYRIVAEWICCEPLEKGHDLCAKGYAALSMIRCLIVDDPNSFPSEGTLTTAVLAVRDEELQQLQQELAALKTIARGYCPHCGRGDCAPTADQWQEQQQRADQAEAALARFHEGEAAHHEYTDTTPAQWIWHWNRATPAERLEMAARIQDMGGRAEACRWAAHEKQIEQLRAQLEDAERRVGNLRSSYATVTEMFRSYSERAIENGRRAEQAEAAIERVRDAATLHRQGLIRLSELHAVIGPALDPQDMPPAPPCTAEATVERVRQLRDAWLRNCLEPGQVRRLLDELTAALDPKETP